MLSDPSEGVFFVVRLPSGWQLCTCRHDEYGPLGLPDFWVETLAPFLNVWIEHFQQHDPQQVEDRHQALERALGQIVAGFDAFPRGEVRRGDTRRTYVIRHGGDLSRKMHVSRREIEESFGICGRVKWVADERLVSATESARRLREHFPIAEHWEQREKRKREAGD